VMAYCASISPSARNARANLEISTSSTKLASNPTMATGVPRATPVLVIILVLAVGAHSLSTRSPLVAILH